MSHELFKYVRYIISGGSAAAVNIGALYLLTEFGHIYYLLSATIAFVFGFAVSFTLQKFWTFKNTKRDGVHKQLFLYFVVSLLNLGFNLLLIYILVEFVHLWYIAAALCSGLCIAFVTFFVYRHFIFTEPKHEEQ